MKDISIITVVYNEETRMDSFLKSFSWADDLIVIEKSSTDKTREIALKYTNKVLTVPYSDTGDEAKDGIPLAVNDWIFFVTASDVIHPILVQQLRETINRDDFDYDVISIPFQIYVFGIQNKRSPWCATHKDLLMKKSAADIRKEVHKELSHKSDRVFKMPAHNEYCLYHLTHETMESFLERHTRYTKLEASYMTDEKQSLKSSFYKILGAFSHVFLRKRIFLIGWDGIALGLAYTSYFIMAFLFVWQKFRGKGPSVYSEIRQKCSQGDKI